MENERVTKFMEEFNVSLEIATNWVDAFDTVSGKGLEKVYFKIFGIEFDPFVISKTFGYI